MHTNTTPAQAADRAPVFDLAAERVILGALMAAVAPDKPTCEPTVFDRVAEAIEPETFYNPRHSELYRIIVDLHGKGHPVEPVALAGYLADEGELARLAPGTFLTDCYALGLASAGSLNHYVNRVADLAQRRTIEAGGVQLAQAATTPGRSIDDLTALAESLIAKAAPRRRSLELAELGSLINPALDDIEHRAKRKAGIPTGYTDLDRLIGGMQPKQMITVAGATGMGKSITLVDIARHVAIKQRLKVAFFSLEMRTKDIFDRILSAETGVLHTRIRDGLLDDNDWQRVTRQIGPMANAPLYLSDKSPMRVADMARICRKMQRTLGLDLVVIDHMHLVKPSNDRIVELPAVIANVSPDIKREIAMALDVPTLVAAQFNRNPSNRLSKIPELGDLKGSSAIEQDSDVVILAHREDYYDKDSPRCGEADFVVAKCRIGERGIVTVAAQLHLSRFVDMAIN